MELILATGNKGKIREIREMLKDLDVTVLTKDDINLPDVIEDGDTFEANALKKAREICAFTGKAALADDSGLEVDALDGIPGVRSARYSGENATDESNNAKLLDAMQGIDDRGAQFHCCMALVLPDGREAVTDGICRGTIGHEPQGTDGFGYDPLFFVPEHKATFGELALDVKNGLSHRGKALLLMREKIEELL